ncbi:unnamed protein product [Closterium sp. Yama58-4]|nr:unnamed protein product [Closterium sp. Yama58-4]
MARTYTPRLLRLFALLSLLLLPSPIAHQLASAQPAVPAAAHRKAAQPAGSTTTKSADQDAIAKKRLQLYHEVVQAIAFSHVANATNGTIISLPSTPASGSTMDLTVLDTASFAANGIRYKEFYLPPGLNVPTTESQVVILYQNYPNFTAPLKPPQGTRYAAQFLGMSVYPFSMINSATLVEPLNVTVTDTNTPIEVSLALDVYFPDFYFCVTFDPDGLPVNSTVTTERSPPPPSSTTPVNGTTNYTCKSPDLGEFTLAISLEPPPLSPPPSPAPPTPPPPGPSSPPSPSPVPTPLPPPSPTPSSSNDTVALAVGLSIGIFFLLLILGCLAWVFWRSHRKARLEKMELDAERKLNLETALVGGNRAPAAGASRTKAVIEWEESLPSIDGI